MTYSFEMFSSYGVAWTHQFLVYGTRSTVSIICVLAENKWDLNGDSKLGKEKMEEGGGEGGEEWIGVKRAGSFFLLKGNFMK